ncbi:MAG: phospholipase D-like domain-containing protein [Myxococcota bacterium]|jgi:phosphatidylserine/phosphatidylglycerophosphate/cardiolipin synthase-like enzyme|nr:phospholipase D-like domain-containing protein [Myxococcota bacterium]
MSTWLSRLVRSCLGLSLSLLVGCSDDSTPEGGDPLPEYDPACPALTLELSPRDVWGRALVGTLVATDEAGAVRFSGAVGPGPVRLPLPAVGETLEGLLAAPGYLDGRFVVRHVGGKPQEALEVVEPSLTINGEPADPWTPLLPAVVRSLDAGIVDGRRCPVLTLHVGLDHPWFAAVGRPAREGNLVALHLDGEEQWAQAAIDLRAARTRVTQSTWWWQSDFELTRGPDHLTLTPEARWANTMMGILEALPGEVLKRVLVARFLDETVSGLENLNTDSHLRTKGRQAGSGFEVLLQGNPTIIPFAGEVPLVRPTIDFAARVRTQGGQDERTFLPSPDAGAAALTQALEVDAASYHQKALSIDGQIGYIGGMNVKSTDWDTQLHRVFEPRRMKYAAPPEERLAVAERSQMPDLGPRKDYFIRFQGPAVEDLEDLFCDRWELGRADEDDYFANATPCVPIPWVGDGYAAGVPAQVIATMPSPLEEVSILESLAKAILQAQSFIYIEDQYFRMPILNDHLIEALTRHPQLQLVVVTKPLSTTDGGKRWTLDADRRLRAAAGDRYHLFQLKAFDAVLDRDGEGNQRKEYYFVDIDTHSKIVIVDDRYLNVGSCNKNNRGLKFEGELNLAVLDQGFVSAQLRRVLAQLLGPELAARLTGDPVADSALLDEAAQANAALEVWWREHGADAVEDLSRELPQRTPQGFLYPLEFDDVMTFPDVGPDLY